MLDKVNTPVFESYRVKNLAYVSVLPELDLRSDTRSLHHDEKTIQFNTN